MKANTVKAENGSELYLHRIQELADEYINNLDNPDDIKGNNKGVFNGMIKYIYNNYFKYNPVNYNDIDFINNIWDIYTSLCYRYNKRPTVLNFSIMIDISMDTINSWKNENTRQYMYYDCNNNVIDNIQAWRNKHPNEDYRQELSTSHSETVKKWLKECEASLFDGATEQNSIGCIFALKANYGYTETAPIPVVNPNQRTLSAAELPKLGGELHENDKQLGLPDAPE